MCARYKNGKVHTEGEVEDTVKQSHKNVIRCSMLGAVHCSSSHYVVVVAVAAAVVLGAAVVVGAAVVNGAAVVVGAAVGAAVVTAGTEVAAAVVATCVGYKSNRSIP